MQRNRNAVVIMMNNRPVSVFDDFDSGFADVIRMTTDDNEWTTQEENRKFYVEGVLFEYTVKGYRTFEGCNRPNRRETWKVVRTF